MIQRYFIFIFTFINCICLFSQVVKPIQLEEIIMQKNKFNAIDLGIISKPFKIKYTKAERRLQDARAGIFAPIINSFNGKIEMLKKEIIIESNLTALEKLEFLFENEFYVKTLKVQELYIKSFQYYVIEDKDFVIALKTNKKDMIMLFMIKLSFKFNEINKT